MGVDPLNTLKIETDLKRSMLADIQHQRQISSYKGRRSVSKLICDGWISWVPSFEGSRVGTASLEFDPSLTSRACGERKLECN